MIDYELVENGCKFILTDKEELIDIRRRTADDQMRLCDILDQARLLGNGFDLEDEVGLTETPAFSLYNAETGADDLYYDPDYQIRCFTEILLRDGEFTFSKY